MNQLLRNDNESREVIAGGGKEKDRGREREGLSVDV